MTTRELIAALEKMDPSGELDAVVENAAIIGVTVLPGYHDGCYHRILPPAIRESGKKVALHARTLEDLLWDLPTVEVDLSDLSEPRRERYAKEVEGWRREALRSRSGRQ